MDEDTSVLIVDDNNEIRDFISLVVRNMGYSALSAESGKEALNILKSNPKPDLILLDVIMPEMTGFDVLKKIKEDASLRNIIVIMVTGVHHIADKELAFTLGASDYIEKPFDTRELIARIKTHINLKKSSEKCIIQRQIQETILSTIPGIVYMKEKKGTYVHGNQMFSDLTGVSLSDISGKQERDLFPDTVANQREKTDGLILQAGLPEIEMQEEIAARNGDTRIYFTRKRPVYNRDNEIAGLVGVSIDITEQVILRDAYSEKEELLTAILNSFPAEIWVFNPEREIILQNYDHLKKNGDLIGKNINEIPVPDKIRRSWSEDLDYVLQGKNRKTGSRITQPDGSEWLMNLFRPVRLNNTITGAIGMNLNLTRWNEDEPDLSGTFPGDDHPSEQNDTGREG